MIKIKKAKALANKKSSIVFGKQVNHPGSKAQPYLKNALDIYIRSGGFAEAKDALAKDIKTKVLNDVKKALFL